MNLSKAQLVALTANFSYIIDISAFAIILPQIAESIQVTPEQALDLYAIYGIALSATLLLGGKFTDRFKVRNLFFFGALLYPLSAIPITISNQYYSVFIFRIFQGIGAAMFSPCIPLIISRSGNTNSAKSLTMWGFWSGIVAAASPLALTFISVYVNWRAAWLVVPILSLFALTGSKYIDDSFRTKHQNARIPSRKTSRLILAYVFGSYGLTTWFIYNFPLSSGRIFNLSSIEIGVYSTALWLTFALTCWTMRSFQENKQLFVFLKISPLLIMAAALLYHVTPLSVFLIGIAMALANMPTTEVILRNTDSSEYGFVASLDIVCARLGGAIFVTIIPEDAIMLIGYNVIFCTLLLTICIAAEK